MSNDVDERRAFPRQGCCRPLTDRSHAETVAHRAAIIIWIHVNGQSICDPRTTAFSLASHWHTEASVPFQPVRLPGITLTNRTGSPSTTTMRPTGPCVSSPALDGTRSHSGLSRPRRVARRRRKLVVHRGEVVLERGVAELVAGARLPQYLPV